MLALGVSEKEIDLSERFGLYPQDSRIERLIEDFEPEDLSWITIRPLCFQAYELRLELLAHIDELRDLGNDESAAKITPEDWMNVGAEIAWYAYVADLEYIEDIKKAEFGAIGGRSRAGKIFSPAKIAISHALKNGCSSAKEVAAYFETEPAIDEHDVEVYCERDESGAPESFSFMNLSNGRMSRPMKSTTLPSAVSQTKAHLKNQ